MNTSVKSAAAVAVVSGVLAIVACGSSGGDSNFGDGSSGGSSSGSSGESSSGFMTSGGTSGTPPAGPCTGLQCNQVACANGASTTLSGKVYDPSGTVPLYNAVVYIPNAEIAPFTPGISCEQCGTAPSGSPIATALTDAKGNFVLKNAPVGVDFPLVVQVGRWRRKVTIPAVKTQCTDTPLDAGTTRLPRNKTEGDIPKIAITTGDADSLECFLRKIGIADAEFTNPAGTGRVHMYSGNGTKVDEATPSANSLWDNEAELKKYDMVILSCEGSERLETKSVAARDNLKKYLDVGGRVFASHFHYVWYKHGTAPFPTTATWTGANTNGNRDVTVDTSFAKGKAFSEWLTEVKATKATDLKSNVTTVPGAGMGPETARRWLYVPKNGTEYDSKFYSFNTPVAAAVDKQCGRAVYTDIHVSGAGVGPTGIFPAHCNNNGLSPQEKALLFLLMDLASCIQDDTKPPTAPPVEGPK